MSFNGIRTFFNTIHKNKLKMDQRPKCKTRHYKTLRRRHRQNTDINYSNNSFESSPRVMEIKTKINKWDLIKSFGIAKETINKMKR